jgi:vacuolar-type H+-ATPase subunit E/Vma4
MKEMILKIIDDWEKGDVEVTVNEADQAALETVLFTGLAEDVKQGLIIKTGSNVAGGFRIGMKDENVYYDFTDDSIAAILKSFLNKKGVLLLFFILLLNH